MTSTVPRPLLVDQLAPRPDFTRASHVVVEADPATTYRVLRQLDFGDLRGPAPGVVAWAHRVRARLEGRPSWHTRMPLDDLPPGSGWVTLGERPGAEVVVGTIGTSRRPFAPVRDLEARAFADFAVPGYGKVACSLSVLPYGQRRSLLTCETRATATDPRSWSRLRRYWWLAGPWTALLERAALRSIKDRAERGDHR
ncbi:hypothetical protein AB0425_15215 [Actinosynnema sp. NPDC051121]